MNKYPNFIIIGAMKCATSSLHSQLALQPGIFMSEPKEPNFFSNDEEFAKGINWYLSLFQDASPSDICGESSTHYTKLPTYPKTIERIQQYVPDARFIYVMRHPLDRLISQYIHQWSEAEISIDINQAIYRHHELIDYSLYTKQLQPYFDTFGKDKVLPIFFERLLKSPQDELERVCTFIGYANKPTWDNELDAQNVSSERMRKNPLRDAIIDAPIIKQIRQNFIPKDFRTQIRNLWTMKRKPELGQKEIEYLTYIFDEDLKLLGSWLGIDLSCKDYKSKVINSSYNWVK